MQPDELRVLHVVEATTAGTKRHVLDLAAGLRARGVINHVACPPKRQNAYGDTDFVPQLRRLDVPVHPMPFTSGPNLWLDTRSVIALYGLIQQGGFDIIHTHSAKAGFLGRLAARLGRRQIVVYTPHAFGFQRASGSARNFYRLLERLAARWTDAFICVSPSEYSEAAAQLLVPAERLLLIRNGIDVRRFDGPVDVATVRGQLGVGSAPLIVSVGRLTFQKAMGVLLDACSVFIARYPKAQVLIVGDGPERRRLEAQAVERGLENCVTFTGYRADVPAILASADVFALASRYEGLPYTVLEAMAAGKPVVATDVTGTRDAVVPALTGILTKPNNPVALGEAIAHLLDNPAEGQKLGRAGRRRVEQHFTVGQMIAETCALYERLSACEPAVSVGEVSA